MTTVWLNGVVSDAAEARVHPLDHGLTVGDGVFETLAVQDGTPVAVRRHLARLRRSAELMGLRVPYEDGELRAAMAEVIGTAGPATVGRLRMTVTGGPGPLGSGRDDVVPTVLLAAGPGSVWSPVTPVATVGWSRNERSAVAGAKTTSYAENVVALAEAHRRGATEALLENTKGRLCEGTGTNVFLAREGVLTTPSLSTGCLAGITRDLVLELVEVVESDELTFDALREADEAFLTSSTRNVQPISLVDDRALPQVPGPRTTAAADALTALFARDLDP